MARETEFGVTRDVYRDSSGNVVSSSVVSRAQLEREQDNLAIGIKLIAILASVAGVIYGLYWIISEYDALEYIAVGLYWLCFAFIVIPKVAALFILKSVRFVSKISTFLFLFIILIHFANEAYGESIIMVGEYFVWGTEETIFETYFTESFLAFLSSAVIFMISAYLLED